MFCCSKLIQLWKNCIAALKRDRKCLGIMVINFWQCLNALQILMNVEISN